MYDGVIEKPELSEETLAHYGVPGMKWGIRKEYERRASRHGSKMLETRRKKESQGKWGGAKTGSIASKRYNKQMKRLTKSRFYRSESDATKAAKHIRKQTAITGGALLGIGLASTIAVKKISEAYLGVPINVKSSVAQLLANTAITSAALYGTQSHLYSKYGKIQDAGWHGFGKKSNKGK